MDILNFTWYYVVLFLAVLSVLIFVHEMGHFLVARLCGVRIEVFSIGFGPEVCGWNDRSGTRWKIGYLPLGGYVKMFGMDELGGEGEEQPEMTPQERAVSFQHKPLARRAAIVAAGPVANFLFAILVFAGVFYTTGVPFLSAVVGEVLADSAASEAGMEPGDRIVAIDGQPVELFRDLLKIVRDSPGVPLEITVRRGEGDLIMSATPRRIRIEDESGETVEIGRLGIMADPSQVKYQQSNLLNASWLALSHTADITGKTLSFLGEIFTGQRTTEDIGGILRIAKFSGMSAQGGIVNLLSFIALLSINLGLINLFPIPILDGGYLVFYAFEAVRGRPLGPRVQEYGLRFGLILVLLLVIFVTWNDLVHLKVVDFFQRLIS